jgi:hypothetical protein
LTHAKPSKSSSSRSIIQTTWKLLYQSSFNNTNLSNIYFSPTVFQDSTDIFRRLSFYETSFHFFLKRVKLFINLSSHNPTIRPLPFFSRANTQAQPDNLRSLYPLITILNAQGLVRRNLGDLEASVTAQGDYQGSVTRDFILSSFDKTI